MGYSLKQSYHVAVPTAFYEDEELNTVSTLEHIINLQASGVKSVLVCGSTGEQHSLTLKEKIILINAIQQEARLDKEVEIIFGVSSIRQKEAILLVNVVNKASKISGILLGFPPYIVPTQIEALAYVNKITSIAQKPIILYNNPRRTGFDLETQSILTLQKNLKIVGLKEAGEATRVADLVSKIDKEFYFYAGGEIALQEKMKQGFNRLSSISGNLYPVEIEKWFDSLCRGEQPKFPLHKEVAKIFDNSPLVYLKKEISKKEKIAMGLPRSPLGNTII